ncbi:hypothetical protein ACFL4X_01640 [Gemmatimonadota bacterium]
MKRGLMVAIALLALCAWDVSVVCAAAGLEREFEKTVALRGGGSVQLKNVTGPATVTGWDREEVQIRAVITLDREPMDDEMRELFEKVEIVVEHSWNGVKIRTKYPDSDWDGDNHDVDGPEFDFDLHGEDSEHSAFAEGILAMVGQVVGNVTGWVTGLVQDHLPVKVSYEVYVPRKCDLEVKTVTGDLLITGVEGAIETSLVTGNTSLVDVIGGMDCGVVTGNIEIEGADGEIKTSVVTGNASLSMKRDGDFKGIHCNVINGDVLVRIPEMEAFDFDFYAVNGKISMDTEAIEGIRDGSSHIGSMNGGGPDLNIKAINGSIRLERAVR